MSSELCGSEAWSVCKTITYQIWVLLLDNSGFQVHLLWDVQVLLPSPDILHPCRRAGITVKLMFLSTFYMIYNDMQWYATICNDMQSYVIICNDIQWYTLIYNEMQWCHHMNIKPRRVLGLPYFVLSGYSPIFLRSALSPLPSPPSPSSPPMVVHHRHPHHQCQLVVAT